MKLVRWTLGPTLCGTLFCFAAAPAVADTGPYLGGSLGYSFIEDRDDVDAEDRVEEFDIDDEDFAWKGYVGYQMLPWLAVEGGYVDFGDVQGDSPSFRVRSELDGWDAFLVGNLPLAFVDVFAKVGVISWDLDVDFDDGLDEDNVSSSGEDLAYGVGAGIELGQLTLRAEAEMFEVDDVDDLFMLSVGAALHF